MKILVIPDVHLKPWMFRRASELMEENIADKIVCLMDIADDWNQQWNLDLYIQSYDATISFAKDYPDTLWCYGNHDACYPWNQRETGYSRIAPRTVCDKPPVKEIYREGNVISCDVFSTDEAGKPIGTQEFLLIDTNTWEFKGKT